MPPPPKQHLAATQDLLARFNLLFAYDRYVRPTVLPGDDPSIPSNPDGAMPTPGPSADKGKGKERDANSAPTPAAEGQGHDGDEDEAVGKGEKKKKNTYKHLIKGVPGTLSSVFFLVSPSALHLLRVIIVMPHTHHLSTLWHACSVCCRTLTHLSIVPL